MIVGGGPAGLMAAQGLQSLGFKVHIFDAMSSVGRKFLLAGRGGLNLTHSEQKNKFLNRFHPPSESLISALESFSSNEVCEWVKDLGSSIFIGSSGRIFPTYMKASPLLRAWLNRLEKPNFGAPVSFHLQHRWLGWTDDQINSGPYQSCIFQTNTGLKSFSADALVLAMGGGSWSRLGSDGLWFSILQKHHCLLSPLRPSNSGFDLGGEWTPLFLEKFVGRPLKSISMKFTSHNGDIFSRRGELVVTETGIEGSLIYAASRLLRDTIEHHGSASVYFDLLPDHSDEDVLANVCHPRGSRSLSSHLKSRLNLSGIKMALLYECLSKVELHNPNLLARSLKNLPILLGATRPLDEAISSAGGVKFDRLSRDLMMLDKPGVFLAGEMLDWEAPTGGYLLTACLATGMRVAHGIREFLK